MHPSSHTPQLTHIDVKRLHPSEELRQRFGTRVLQDEALDDQPVVPGRT